MILYEEDFEEIEQEVPAVETEVIPESEIQPEGPEQGLATGVANLIHDLIIDENEAIQQYNNAAANMDEYPEIQKIMHDIAGEEFAHIGELEKALETISPNAANIEEGEVESEENLEDIDPGSPVDESLNEEGDLTNDRNLVDYVEYKHSYAHALEPKLKAIKYNAFVNKKPAAYIKAIIKNALKNPEVRWTDKEYEFYENILNMYSSSQLYYYVKNAINKAHNIEVYVDDKGELIESLNEIHIDQMLNESLNISDDMVVIKAIDKALAENPVSEKLSEEELESLANSVNEFLHQVSEKKARTKRF